MKSSKNFMILARRDMREAMRVAAGMTIFGHRVRLAFATRALSQAEAEGEEAELLDLAEVETITNLPDMSEFSLLLSSEALATAIFKTEMVICL